MDVTNVDKCKDCNNSNTLIFTVGRMNPPTPGHLELISEMLTMAKAKNVKQIYIFLSETRGPKDPISCADKVTVLTGSYDHVNNINIWANVAEFARNSMQNVDNDKVAKANEVAVLARNAATATANASNVNIQSNSKSMIQSLKDNMTATGIDVADITVNTICFSGSTVFKYIDYYANNLTQSLVPPNSKSVYLVGFFGGDRDEFGVAIEKSFKNKYSYFAPPSSPRAGMEKFKNLYTNNPELLIVDKSHTDYHSMADIVNAGAMSASLVRLIVKQGHAQNPVNDAKFKARFTELYEPYLDVVSIDKLYYDINQGIEYYTKIVAEEAAIKEAVKSAKEAAKALKKAATPIKAARPTKKMQPVPTGGQKTLKRIKKRKSRKKSRIRKKRRTKKRSTI
jgi:hypothetical protein